MDLVHRTNYWGSHINATDNDDEVPFEAIWVQATRCCCPDLAKPSLSYIDISDEFQGWWSLFW